MTLPAFAPDTSPELPPRPSRTWSLRPIPAPPGRVAVPALAPASTPPAVVERDDALHAPLLRLRPDDPLHRRAEATLTRRGWRPQPSTRPLPHPYPWAHTMVRVLFEVLEGVRTCEQLARWLAPDLYEALRERERLTRRTRIEPRPIRTRSLRLQKALTSPEYVAFECIGVVDVDGRSRAVSLRAESYAGRWRITALEIG